MRLSKGIFAAIVGLTVLALSAKPARAQSIGSFSIGTFHSPKGFGLCFESRTDSLSFDSVALIADIYGLPTGEHTMPGVKFTYYRSMIVSHYEMKDYSADIYAGPGVTAGYARDINEPFGVIAGLAGVFGGRFIYDRNISVAIELGADLALEVNKNDRFGNLDLKLYKSGIYHFFYPQLRLEYRF